MHIEPLLRSGTADAVCTATPPTATSFAPVTSTVPARPLAVKGPRPRLNDLLLVANSTLLLLSTVLLVLLGSSTAWRAGTIEEAVPAHTAVPTRWRPDFAARSFYDAHLTFIVEASHADILERRKVEPGAGLTAPKGRYRVLAVNHTKVLRNRRGQGRGRGAGAMGVAIGCCCCRCRCR